MSDNPSNRPGNHTFAAWLWAAAVLLAVIPRAGAMPPDGELDQIARLADSGLAQGAFEDLERLLKALPEGQRMICWKADRARVDRRLRQAWPLAGGVAFLAGTDRSVGRLDVAGGQALPPLMEAGPDQSEPAWVCPAADGQEALVLTPSRVVRVDPASGKAIASAAGKFDSRIAPIGCTDGFIAVPGYRAEELVRLKWSGEELWRCRLPGYVMVHPSRYGSVLVVQTRQGSYGGQATTAVDTDTGNRLWSETTNAYGCGTAFGDDMTFLVEADDWMDPSGAEGRIICRDARRGVEKWRYAEAGAMAARPVVWPAHGLIYVAFRSGRVVCLDGRSGQIRWVRALPAAVADDGGDSYRPQREMMRFADGVLILLDGRRTVHFLDGLSGKLRGSFTIEPPTTADGKAHNYNQPIAAPWLAGDRLIVPTEQWIAAYPAAGILGGAESLELRAAALRARLLAKLDRGQEAIAELRRIQAARPGSPTTLALQADLFAPGGPAADGEAEIIARLQLLRANGGTEDRRLQEAVGLVRRIEVGAGPTAPLVLGQSIYVGTAAGRLWRLDLATGQPLAKLDLHAGIVSDLTFFDGGGGMIVFATGNRHTVAVSPELQVRFDLPSRSDTEYYVLGDKLIRSWPAIPYTHLSVLDVAKPDFGPEVRVERYPPGGVVHGGRLYFARPGGATVSYDGTAAKANEARLAAKDFGVEKAQQATLWFSVEGTMPLGFGAGGVYRVDEHLRPWAPLVALGRRVFAASSSRTAVVALSEQPDSTKPWLLEAWSADGLRKLALRYETHRYSPYFDFPPRLVPLGEGFLLVGRELAYVLPDRPQPAWRFFPGGLRDAELPSFKGPAICAARLFATHRDGDLLVIDLQRITAPR